MDDEEKRFKLEKMIKDELEKWDEPMLGGRASTARDATSRNSAISRKTPI